MTENEAGLEHAVQHNYIIYVQHDKTKPETEAAFERQQRFQALVERAEQLQQEYGTEKFFAYRRFEYVKAIAAVIKENSIIETLKGEGYVVEKQGIIRAQGVKQQKP